MTNPPPDPSIDGNPQGIGFWALVGEDRRTQEEGVWSPGFWVLFWHRFGNRRMGWPKPLRAPATLLYKLAYRRCRIAYGIDLPYTVRVGRRVRLDHSGGMILVAERIGDEVTLRQNTTLGIKRVEGEHQRPVLGARADIGAGAVIVGGVSVGADALVGANAVVTKDVPPGAVAAGIPAKVIAQAAPGEAGAALPDQARSNRK